MPPKTKKQAKFMQAVANNPEFANKVGVNQSIGREFTKEKDMKTKKMNMGGRTGDMMYSRGYGVGNKGKRMPTELMTAPGMKKGGGVSKRTKHIMNEKDEIRRVDKEIRKNEGYMKGGKVKGYDEGGKVTMTSMMKDKEGRAIAKNKKKMTKSQIADAAGRAMGKAMRSPEKRNFDKVMADSKRARTGGSSAPMKAKGKKMMGGGKVKAYKKGGSVSSASKRADGCVTKGHTRGRMV
jgi:hypothetical protein